MNIVEIIAIVGLGLNLLANGFVVAMFCVVKFNDLAHFSKKLDKIEKNVDNLNQRVSNIEGQLSSK